MREYLKFKYLFALAVVVALLGWLGAWGIQEGRTSGLSELSVAQTYTAEQFTPKTFTFMFSTNLIVLSARSLVTLYLTYFVIRIRVLTR